MPEFGRKALLNEHKESILIVWRLQKKNPQLKTHLSDNINYASEIRLSRRGHFKTH